MWGNFGASAGAMLIPWLMKVGGGDGKQFVFFTLAGAFVLAGLIILPMDEGQRGQPPQNVEFRSTGELPLPEIAAVAKAQNKTGRIFTALFMALNFVRQHPRKQPEAPPYSAAAALGMCVNLATACERERTCNFS